MTEFTILGIETSCDETAASVVRRHQKPDGTAEGEILSNIVRTQLKEHAAFGGVVPEIAARAHAESLAPIIRAALEDASLTLDEIDAIAATTGPGLIGGLLVGMMTGKAIAAVKEIPFIPVNHLAGHALTVGLTNGHRPPYLLLLVSGGHTQLIWVEAIGKYTRIGSTIDDALGEAFDKTAKLLGLGYPGGPQVEKWALQGDPTRFKLPRPLLGRPEPNFSFSGLKTALRQEAQKLEPLTNQDIHDLCASFQHALAVSVIDRVGKALDHLRNSEHRDQLTTLVVAGGVAANKYLRTRLEGLTDKNNLKLVLPPLSLCTDNAAMIAWAAAEELAAGINRTEDSPARARWPLDETATPLLGSGKGGMKA
ncbi:MAG: tRNA N6-adenosine threonylcarbamoyltransferase [Rhodomicrobium sp.]|nr:MAG: tRNA N6-adenosine threonylcarbamoyltransferase [Rhodomicrobium sp.]